MDEKELERIKKELEGQDSEGPENVAEVEVPEGGKL